MGSARTPSPPPVPRRPGCSVTIVMAFFTACLVLVVATISFSITYITSISQLRTIGATYAESLVTTTSLSVSEYFDAPAALSRAVTTTFLRQDIELPLPSDDPFQYLTLNRTLQALLPIYSSSGGAIVRMSVSFDDGSQVYIEQSSLVVRPQTAATASFGVTIVNHGLAHDNFGPYISYGFSDPQDMRPIRFAPRGSNGTHTFSILNPAYIGLRPYYADSVHGYWFFPEEADIRTPVIPATFPLRNATTFLGIGSFYIRTEALTKFFGALRGTANTQIFAIDYTGAISATTYNVTFTTYRTITLQQAANVTYYDIPSNCWSTSTLLSDYERNIFQTFQYSCRTYAKDYPYPPLQAAVSLVEGNVTATALHKLVVGDETYYVAAATIKTSLSLTTVPFPMHLQLFMPESDVIGDVVAIRSVCLSATVAIVIVAAGVATLGIYVILSPLRAITQRLASRATMSHHVGGGDMADSTFAIAEVEHLKTAFDKMRDAVDSFERYVPRTVVKELIGAGNLCHIAMEHRACTMMFTQISRFGDMCDAVSMDLLAPLLRIYFARVSEIVADRDGVVDKFIGDTIMIVWGAPKETADREKKAVLSGLLIVRAAKQPPLREGFRAIGEKLRTLVGVASGLVLAGNMGSSERMNYSVIGDAVSAASRLIECCRQLSTRFLVDAATARACETTYCLRRLICADMVSNTSDSPPIASQRLPCLDVFEVLGVLPAAGVVLDGSVDDSSRLSGASLADVPTARTIDGSVSIEYSMQTSLRFNQTQSSSVSVAPETTATLTVVRTTSDNFCIEPQNAPLLVDDEVSDQARIVTAAADAYLQGRFTECITLIDGLLERYDRVDTAVARLRVWAELETTRSSSTTAAT